MRYTILLLITTIGAILPQGIFAHLIEGQVIDNITKEPIIGATIHCYPDSVYCYSDSIGRFTITEIKNSRIDIEVESTGYERALLSQILITSVKDLFVIIELKERLYELCEITVSARHPKMLAGNDMALTSARSFSVEECRRYAGGLDDPARMVSNFAGCGTVTPESNAIIVRGNSPLGVLWRLEGVDIPSPVHFNGSGDLPGGGLYTIFNSFMLANSDFYSGCFPAEFFNAVGGVFDMRLRQGNPLRHKFSSQIGVQGFEISAEGPLSTSHKSSFMCNGRLSTMQLLNSIVPELSNSQKVSYHDYSAKLDIPTSKIGHFSIWSIWGGSKMNRNASNDPDLWVSPSESSDVTMKNSMFASGISNEKSFGNRVSIRNTIAFTNERRYLAYGIRQPRQPNKSVTDYTYDGDYSNFIVSSVWNHKISGQFIGRYGLTYKQIWDDCKYQLEDNPNKLSCDYKHTAYLLNGHGQFRYPLSSNISTLFGGTLTYFSLSHDCSIEPRIGIEYKPNNTHSVALGAGLHSQIAPLYIYLMDVVDAEGKYSSSNRDLKMMKAFQTTISYNWVITPVCRLKVEPYFQYSYDVPVIANETFSIINLTNQPTMLSKRFVNKGAGINMGCDVTFEKFLSQGYYYMGTLSIFKSSYRDYFDNWYSTMFDARWYINILGGKEFIFTRSNGLNKILGVNAHLSLSGHVPYTPLDYKQSYISQSLIYDYTIPYSCRKKGVNILSDISLTYMVNYRLFSGTIALQIKNLLGKQYLGQFFNLSTNSIEDLYFNSPIPLLSYKIEF